MQRPMGLHLEGSPTARERLACHASKMAEAIGATPRIGSSQARWGPIRTESLRRFARAGEQVPATRPKP
jgi:hypothetical protein